MKRIGVLALLAGIFVGFLALGAGAADVADVHDDYIGQAAALLHKFESMSEADGLGSAIMNSKGVAVFPAVLDIAVGVGGKGGNGVVLARDGDGNWRGPSFATMAGLSVGLQAGAQELGIIFVINDDKGFDEFAKGRSFQVGADTDAVAGPWGVDVEVAEVGRGVSLYTYTLDKGVFAGIAVDGTMISAASELNRLYWNKETSPSEALNMAAEGQSIAPLIEELKKLEKKAE